MLEDLTTGAQTWTPGALAGRAPMSADLKELGYRHIPGVLTPSACDQLFAELLAMEKAYYTPENLASNAVYISDNTPTRISHAMMVARRPDGVLPAVGPVGPALSALMIEAEELLGRASGVSFAPETRTMVNFQRYLAGSKEVAEHFDGHYIAYEKTSPTSFRLHEGLLPRHVVVITLMNENHGHPCGTVLRDTASGREISPPSAQGDLLIFDNLRFRHSVPKLEKPRVMVGLRTFDAGPYHFVAEPRPGYSYLADRDHPGYVTALSNDQATERLVAYYRDLWPEHWRIIQREGALF